ncbi:MAG: class I SAM-dependent methyltransferase [Rickettsiales bacterium]|jgi:SAM-dependent methyltransferase|nr:class I SAM-dependent methyltransferase [Rickettsiales bacterium]
MLSDLLQTLALILLAAFIFHYGTMSLISIVKGSVPPVPSNARSVGILAGILRGMFPKGRFTLLDIGSGSGKAALAIAGLFPKARVIGVEHSPYSFVLSRIRALFARRPNVRFYFADFFNVDLKKLAPDVAYMYLSRHVSAEIAGKLACELPGIAVVSNRFSLPLRLCRRFDFKDLFHGPILVYESYLAGDERVHDRGA